ncbi:TPA: hypothetical protein KOR49_002218 [Clostridioides difficile]|uniref:Uncharacterized protein n=1 Tax=Clostridioides difficile TaxID=1496 RepID=A0AAN6A7Z9_CLODI|nr:hypothetical protein [Clostridioides difficile]EGT3944772.1 hypothetical protein [Clostridioides difficile]MBG0197889.1 hypothetical protein [Clostridioides difficile]MCA0574414.1 hypothetical protein [Clostridioides difficile]MDW0077008.1 hypothetical protein [Clostridioides difficile]SJT14973.1 Uncharacterised protein [Clostridioides difficile]
MSERLREEMLKGDNFTIKKYILVLYNADSIVSILSFDNIEEVKHEDLNKSKNIDKIRIFKSNNKKEDIELIKEYKLKEIVSDDSLFMDEGTKLLGYDLKLNVANSIVFRIKFEMTKELQLEHELWYKKRSISLRLVQSNQDESVVDVESEALTI